MLNFFVKGGPVMYPLLVCSIISLAIIFERTLFWLRLSRNRDEERVGRILELAEKEERELKILETYLPEQISAGELAAAIDSAIEEIGAAGPSDVGKVMKAIMSKYQGQVDGKVVRQLVQEKLASVQS